MLVQFFSLFPSATCSFIHKARRQGSFLHFIVLIVRGEVIRLPEKEVPVLAHQANVYKCIRSKNLVWQSIWRFFFFFLSFAFFWSYSLSHLVSCAAATNDKATNSLPLRAEPFSGASRIASVSCRLSGMLSCGRLAPRARVPREENEGSVACRRWMQYTALYIPYQRVP